MSPGLTWPFIVLSQIDVHRGDEGATQILAPVHLLEHPFHLLGADRQHAGPELPIHHQTLVKETQIV